MERIDEGPLFERVLSHLPGRPRLLQIGANDGRHEPVKVGGADPVFGFLAAHPHWQAALIEPLPAAFERLKRNYAGHANALTFLNAAVAEGVRLRAFRLHGPEGRASHLLEDDPADALRVQCLTYPLVLRILNWDGAEAVKIDAEGYDEQIVHRILDADVRFPPRFLMWEQIGPERMDTSARLRAAGYRVVVTGRDTGGGWRDRAAIREV